MTNTELLNKRIDESGLKRKSIAKRLGLTAFGLLKKINGENEFKVSEVVNLCNILAISDEDREQIFLHQKVIYNQP